jgi:hypothetical protein
MSVWFLPPPATELISALEHEPAGHALDLACGFGRSVLSQSVGPAPEHTHFCVDMRCGYKLADGHVQVLLGRSWHVNST